MQTQSQLRVPSMQPLITETQHFFWRLMSDHLPAVFSPPAQLLTPYYNTVFKLLWCAPGDGLQQLHFDIPKHAEAAQRYSMLFYCSNHSKHTAMPNGTADELAVGFTRTKETTEGQQSKIGALFDKVGFVSKPVPAGSAMIFKTTVAHYGVANEAFNSPRVVIYALFTPTKRSAQDAIQRFPLGVDPKL